MDAWQPSFLVESALLLRVFSNFLYVFLRVSSFYGTELLRRDSAPFLRRA